VVNPYEPPKTTNKETKRNKDTDWPTFFFIFVWLFIFFFHGLLVDIFIRLFKKL